MNQPPVAPGAVTTASTAPPAGAALSKPRRAAQPLRRGYRWLQRTCGNRLARLVIGAVVAMSAAASPALLQLLVGDLTSHDPHTPPNIWRCILPFITLPLLLASLWLLALGRRVNGTLYYLRILGERAPDLHAASAQSARESSLDHRSVTRTIRLGPKRWVDIAEVVSDARRELERASNDDVTSTSFELAPNAYWPAAFAIGYDWPLPEDTTLIEFNADTRSFDVGVSTRCPGLLHPPGAATANTTAAGPNQRLVHVDVFLTAGQPITPTARVVADRDIFGRDADAVMLWGAAPTGQREPTLFTSTELQPGQPDPRRPVTVGGGPEQLQPDIAADGVARAVLTALDAYPRATVVLTARIPKTVAVLAGRYLAQYLQRIPLPPKPAPVTDEWKHEQARYEHWHDPWSRIVCLNYDAGRMQALRVHDGQPRSFTG